MQILILGGTQFVGRHIVEALLTAGHTVSILTRGRMPDALPASVERLRGDRDAGAAGLGALVGPRITWAEFMQTLGAKHPIWVDAEILRSAGLTERELPLFRPERGPRSSLMDVSNERARAAGLTLTDPAITVRDTRAWSLGKDLPFALPSEREAELIRIARQG